MDRAAFLRASNFFVPLPPWVWECAVGCNHQEDCDQQGDNNEDGPYSGSTITPPTPSKPVGATLPFGDLDCVVSIEPSLIFEKGLGDRSVVEKGHKRHRSSSNVDEEEKDDDVIIQKGQDLLRGGKPAFFAGTINKLTDGGDIKDVDDGNGGTKVDSFGRDQLNSDPSLCTFQAAIIQQDALLLLPSHPEESARKTIDHRDTMIEIREPRKKALLFRFGHRFVFRVDDSAIVEMRYEPGSTVEDGANIGSVEGADSTTESPLSKRRKLESGRICSPAENGRAKMMTTRRQLPPCVLISFSTCTFRIFSLDKKNGASSKTVNATTEETNRPSSRIWNTLKPTEAESVVEDTLMNARSVLLQHFDIESNRRRERSSCNPLWKMAPPGSGVAFHTWPEETFDSSCFHRATTPSTSSYETNNFSCEGWICCLDERSQNNVLKCPSSVTTTSPPKSGSQSKSSGSSTHFEHGQKEQVPTTSSSQSHSTTTAVENDVRAKHQHEDKNGYVDQLSYEQSQDKHHNEEGGGKLQSSQSASSHELGENPVETEKTNNIECILEVDKENNQGDTSRIDDVETCRGGKLDSDQYFGRQQQLWKDEICERYKSFEESVNHMGKAIECSALAAASHHLTSCAESLSDSFLSMNEFTIRSQECEDEIDRITTELESVLDMMFPARGERKVNEALTKEKSSEFQRKVEELVLLRKEAVAAKFALLMMPKR